MRPDLIAEYAEQRLPRYTSYPTAPHFNVGVSAVTYGQWLGARAPDTVGSLYVHIPFCRKMCWYCGCNTAVTLRDEPILAYAEALRAEIGLVGAALGRRLPITQQFSMNNPTTMWSKMISLTGALSAIRRIYGLSRRRTRICRRRACVVLRTCCT